MIERKDCEEFQNTGLLLFVNQFLHIFGWVIVVEINGVGESCMYPARTDYKGFDVSSTSKAYKKLSKFIHHNINEL
jgi:hypothetical protein